MKGLLLLGAMLLTAPAGAQSLKPFTDCAALVADAERLACYDRAVAAISPEASLANERRAAAAAAAARAAAEQAEARRVAEFGRSGMRGADAGDSPDPETVDATIRSVQMNRERKVLVTLDNGQVWRQASNMVPSGIRPGSKVTLKRGTLGSVRMVVDGPGTQVLWVVRVS